MSATATVTGVVGPGITLTTQVFNNVTSITFEPVSGNLVVVSDLGITHIDISAAATVTYTINGSTVTIAVS